jgi:toxin FitB
VILLDTNVVSEPLRPAPDARVTEWIDAQALETLFLSAITVAELRAGLALLPAGKRRAGLQENLGTRVLPSFPAECCPLILAAPGPVRNWWPGLAHRGWPLPAQMATSLPLPWPMA